MSERMPLKCAMQHGSAGRCGARACNYPFCVEGTGDTAARSADIRRAIETAARERPDEWTHRRRRCPCCGKYGFRSARWIGPQLIGHCRAGHPYILEQQ